MKILQADDPQLKAIIDMIKTDEQLKKRYDIQNNLLCRFSLNEAKIMLPDVILEDLTREIREIYGHIGANKIAKMLSEYFFFRKLRQKLDKILHTCDTYQKTKYMTYKPGGIVQPILTDKPNEILSIDFFGPLPTSTGDVKYLLTTVDIFSKYVVIYPIKKANTMTVIRKILTSRRPASPL